MDLRKRSLNVHVGESFGGNYSIETLPLEWQAFTGPEQVSSIWESRPGGSYTVEVEVKSTNLIRSGDTP